MITTLMVACAIVAWESGEGAVAHYFHEDGLEAIVAFDPEMGVCRVEYGVTHIYIVQGFTANGVGPMSDTLTVEWMFDFDADDDGIVGFADFGAFAAAFNVNDLRYDADGSGAVGWGDFAKFVERYGECNDGQRVVSCI